MKNPYLFFIVGFSGILLGIVALFFSVLAIAILDQSYAELYHYQKPVMTDIVVPMDSNTKTVPTNSTP